jgi:DNA polymerase-3 subunit gamma/tau
MSYQVLARKWRPRGFDALVGQEHVVRALTNALGEGRLHHAYLFTGTRGVGKTTLARILAKSLNCDVGVSPAPCGQCASCKEIDAGRFVDLLEVDAATNTRVDEMRVLLEDTVYAPTRGRYKVYVIDEVHMLSNSAFNAMLKTLEEPPEHLKFILATTDPQKIPVTVLSRCLQFNLRQLAPATIQARMSYVLEQEGIRFEAAALQQIAAAAAGSMRDALSLLDQAIGHGAGAVLAEAVADMLGSIDRGYLFDLLDAVHAGEATAALNVGFDIGRRNLSLETALGDLANLLTRVALAQVAPAALPEDEPARQRVLALATAMDAETVQLYYQIAVHGRRELNLAPDPQAGFDMIVLRLLAFRPDVGVQAGAAAQARRSTPAAAQAKAAAPPRQANPPVSAPAEAIAVPPQQDPSWSDLLARTTLPPGARQLAEHCEFRGREGARIKLILPPPQRALLTARERLEQGLREVLGADLKLEIEVAEAGGTTLAEAKHSAEQAAIEAARRALENDEFVRSVQRQFGGQILAGSIRPVGES